MRGFAATVTWMSPCGPDAADCFFSDARLGMRVRQGDALGMIRDLDGTPLEEVRSPQDGVLVMFRTNPRIFAGEILLVVNA